MKKGSIILMISLMMISIGLVSAVQNCTDGTTPTQCVCGHTPNSAQGYGQVIIGGFVPTIISCNNIADGVCPEDFMDPSSGKVANCSNCPDPDCTVSSPSISASVSGHVRDSNGRPIERAVITSHPIKFNGSANLESNVTTRGDGFYNSTSFVTGSYYLSASKDTYDTQLLPVNVIRGQSTVVDFVLFNGTCHEDCTNSYNRCNAACDGITFGNSTGTKCKFYNSTVKELCNNRLKGTEVYLSQINDTTAWFIQCCGDGSDLKQQPYPKYYTKASTQNGDIKNLIKVEKIAKYNDVPVRVVVAYWQP